MIELFPDPVPQKMTMILARVLVYDIISVAFSCGSDSHVLGAGSIILLQEVVGVVAL